MERSADKRRDSRVRTAPGSPRPRGFGRVADVWVALHQALPARGCMTRLIAMVDPLSSNSRLARLLARPPLDSFRAQPLPRPDVRRRSVARVGPACRVEVWPACECRVRVWLPPQEHARSAGLKTRRRVVGLGHGGERSAACATGSFADGVAGAPWYGGSDAAPENFHLQRAFLGRGRRLRGARCRRERLDNRRLALGGAV